MKPRVIDTPPQEDLFRSRLENIISLCHPLVKLADSIDWAHLNGVLGEFCEEAITCKANEIIRLPQFLIFVILRRTVKNTDPKSGSSSGCAANAPQGNRRTPASHPCLSPDTPIPWFWAITMPPSSDCVSEPDGRQLFPTQGGSPACRSLRPALAQPADGLKPAEVFSPLADHLSGPVTDMAGAHPSMADG